MACFQPCLFYWISRNGKVESNNNCKEIPESRVLNWKYFPRNHLPYNLTLLRLLKVDNPSERLYIKRSSCVKMIRMRTDFKLVYCQFNMMLVIKAASNMFHCLPSTEWERGLFCVYKVLAIIFKRRLHPGRRREIGCVVTGGTRFLAERSRRWCGQVLESTTQQMPTMQTVN
jgi:hypothetical protein